MGSPDQPDHLHPQNSSEFSAQEKIDILSQKCSIFDEELDLLKQTCLTISQEENPQELENANFLIKNTADKKARIQQLINNNQTININNLKEYDKKNIINIRPLNKNKSLRDVQNDPFQSPKSLLYPTESEQPEITEQELNKKERLKTIAESLTDKKEQLSENKKQTLKQELSQFTEDEIDNFVKENENLAFNLFFEKNAENKFKVNFQGINENWLGLKDFPKHFADVYNYVSINGESAGKVNLNNGSYYNGKNYIAIYSDDCIVFGYEKYKNLPPKLHNDFVKDSRLKTEIERDLSKWSSDPTGTIYSLSELQTNPSVNETEIAIAEKIKILQNKLVKFPENAIQNFKNETLNIANTPPVKKVLDYYNANKSPEKLSHERLRNFADSRYIDFNSKFSLPEMNELAFNDLIHLSKDFYNTTGHKLPITSAYRNQQKIQDLKADFKRRSKNVKVGDFGRSFHSIGASVDLDRNSFSTKGISYNDFVKMARKHGFINDEYKTNNEPWHFTHMELKQKYDTNNRPARKQLALQLDRNPLGRKPSREKPQKSFPTVAQSPDAITNLPNLEQSLSKLINKEYYEKLEPKYKPIYLALVQEYSTPTERKAQDAETFMDRAKPWVHSFKENFGNKYITFIKIATKESSFLKKFYDRKEDDGSFSVGPLQINSVHEDWIKQKFNLTMNDIKYDVEKNLMVASELFNSGRCKLTSWGGYRGLKYKDSPTSKEYLASNTDSTEILSDKIVKIKCTTKEAIQHAKNGDVFDQKGNRIIYFITDTKPFSNPESQNILTQNGSPKYTKKYVAFHGTGYDEKEFKKANDFQVTRSAINTGAKEGDYAFLIGKNGCIFQFYDENIGFGALGGDLVRQNNLPYDMNRETIAIEIALRGDGDGTYTNGVERPNNAQKAAGKYLGEFLANKYSINQSHFVTSKDPVKGIKGSHNDDFNDKDRLALGIPTKKQATQFIQYLQNNKILIAQR